MKLIYYSLIFFLISNLSLMAAFVVGKSIFKRENMNLSSNYSIFISVLMIFYFLSIITFNFFSFAAKYFLYGLFLLPFLFAPFIIGHFSKFEKINLYMDIQISTLVLSLLTGFWMFFRLG